MAYRSRHPPGHFPGIYSAGERYVSERSFTGSVEEGQGRCSRTAHDGAEVAWLSLLDGAEVAGLGLLDSAEVAGLGTHDGAEITWLSHCEGGLFPGELESSLKGLKR